MVSKTKIVVGVLGVLILVLAVTLMLNKEGLDQRKEMMTNATINIKIDGEENILSFDDLKKAGEEKFEAVLDTSTTDPVVYAYTGVQLKNVLKDQGINLEGKTAVILTAVDGFTVAYSLEEVLLEGNVYVTYAREGEKLKSKEDGGRGPYQTIVVGDQFSSRRCKWLTSIEVQ